ncbi:hypothetical protein BLA23254_06915 [Burkholderia lata]|uniref:Uncharacterized protein n=1 Tax=Burkholderia lata (strain ATCC 17760 / DSM 23089 / LMG 22485 / NCIMB 9086 / R18194 / 383) TaxID=482957 RepID=A0A6P2RT67_BURL3|nr:hypothetical protein [Burkholderia lata]VWC40315.1 hypothetical protein BLA23254_06915 [Burkholderia lata]
MASRGTFNVPYKYSCSSCGHAGTVFFANASRDGDSDVAVCSECGGDVTITLAAVALSAGLGHTMIIGSTGSGKTAYDYMRLQGTGNLGQKE